MKRESKKQVSYRYNNEKGRFVVVKSGDCVSALRRPKNQSKTPDKTNQVGRRRE